MATLDNKSIRGALTGAFKYINHPDKNLPPDGLSAAAAYIRGTHSVERLYSRGHNGCSSNPSVALQQFRACEKMYRQRKAGAREAGLTSSKQPIVAEHFFLSFPTRENVSYQTQCEIVDKLCASEILKDFYAVSNRHWNTDNDHSHILVCNISKDGSHKLSMSKTKRKELRKELDRICALDYGLSIVDSAELRYNDPERVAFVHSLVGKVCIYAPKDYEKVYANDPFMMAQVRAGNVLVAEGTSKNRKGLTQADAYRRWIAEQENFSREKDMEAAKQRQAVLIKEEDLQKKVARAYYWNERYRSSKYNGYYYAVSRYDKEGNRKSTLRLMVELLLIVTDNEHLLMDCTYEDQGDKREQFFASTNWEIQKSYNAMHFQDKYGVRTPEELTNRIAAVGSDLAEARQGYSYYKKALEINPNDYYAKRKVSDLDAQISDLKQEYRDLKFVQSYQYEAERQLLYGNHLDDLINRAQKIASEGQKKNQNFFSKTY